MRNLIFALSALFVTSAASAKDMSCAVAVYKTVDFIRLTPPENNVLIATVEIQYDAGQKDFLINGENVNVSFAKREFADVYDAAFVLTTPETDRVAQTSFVASITDFLINEGPAVDNGWTVNYKPGALSFGFMKSPSGTLLLTQKMKKALMAEGLWGAEPFTTVALDLNQSDAVLAAVKALSAKKAVKENDVLAIANILKCTLNK